MRHKWNVLQCDFSHIQLDDKLLKLCQVNMGSRDSTINQYNTVTHTVYTSKILVWIELYAVWYFEINLYEKSHIIVTYNSNIVAVWSLEPNRHA